MDQTSAFFLFSLAGTLVSLTAIGLSRSPRILNNLARGFFLLCLFLGSLVIIATILSVSGLLAFTGTFGLVFKILIFRGWLVVGAGIVSAVRGFAGSGYVLKGLCLSVSIAFLITEIGKLAHDAEMRQFFLDSGYPVWFLYFVIISETLGSIGLFISKLIIPAAGGLAAIMIGAIYTHLRNGDPFSDSLEAAHLLILLICIIVIKMKKTDSPAVFDINSSPEFQVKNTP
jgi:putative oxidoreductase